jgi:hypothetical protein
VSGGAIKIAEAGCYNDQFANCVYYHQKIGVFAQSTASLEKCGL